MASLVWHHLHFVGPGVGQTQRCCQVRRSLWRSRLSNDPRWLLLRRKCGEEDIRLGEFGDENKPRLNTKNVMVIIYDGHSRICWLKVIVVGKSRVKKTQNSCWLQSVTCLQPSQ